MKAGLAKLTLYYIAFNLFQKAGNCSGMQTCNKALQDAFLSCEGKAPVDVEQAKAATLILNAMSNQLVQVQISDYSPTAGAWAKPKPVKPFTEKEFKESESLRLRAAAIADKLEKTEHVRRKVHRDL